MNIATAHLRKKVKFIMQTTWFAFGIITARLIYLQVNLTDHLLHKSKQNFQRFHKVQPMRGNIIDCNNILLATNRPVTDLYWQGSGNNKLNPVQEKTIAVISTIIDKPLTNDNELHASLNNAERYSQNLIIASDLSFEQLSKLEEIFPNHKNIALSTRFQRYYPYKSYASHILGYLGDINVCMQGKMGLEMLFEDYLKGEHGLMLRIINSVGKKLSEKELKQTLAGYTIQTTLDITLQQIAEEIFPQEYAGTIVVMDPQDGAILALVSRPCFDPSLFLGPISISEWHILQEKQPFLNRAFNASYPPGSIFKLVTASAALEENIIKPEFTWECKGYLHLGKRKYLCNQRYGHGTLTTMQAVAKSCNILFYEIGRRMNIDQIAFYARLFGLGEKTGIIFHEKEGLIPTTKWKLETKGEQWWPGETLSVAIGQSFLLVTPIQVARMISSIFTQELVMPRILTNEPVQKRKLALNPETLSFLQHSMRAVVTQGTGHRISKVKSIEIYAKTSTAQVSGLQKRHLDQSYLEHGWFVAYFCYKNYKPLTIIILIEHSGSSRLPTVTAKNFLIQYKKIMDAKDNSSISYS
ncbi:penicillin-binding protein 2 [Candidatus Dependentiae bacterium]|nr:MAG: penicillin-binding protein 2 [Candidatus Dependentiae bacterium]